MESLLLHTGLVLFFGGVVVVAWLVARRWAQKPSISKPSPVVETDATETAPNPSRRSFLKASLAAGVIALPTAAAASQLLAQRPSYAAISVSDRTRSQLRQKPNIIVIVADALRADHLGSYGYSHATTPNLDELAAHSVRYSHAFAQSAWTKPSMATLLTGLYPSSHATRYKTSALPNGLATLPGILQAQGYVTGGFANNVNIAPFFNFQQGFTDYEFLAPDYLLGASEASSQLTVYQVARMANERFFQSRKNVHSFYQPAEVVNERAVDWLKNSQEEAFFLFLHYMDPHDPYFEQPFNNHGIARVSTPNPPPDMAPDMVRLYDDEITYMDRYLGELFAWLKQTGLYDETLIVFTADHGEEFHEHGGWWHGLTLFDEQIHVPLLVKLPRQTVGEIDVGLARTLDIAPTILRAAGFDVPAAMQGVDLRNVEQERPKFVYAEEDHQGNVLYAGRSMDWKYMAANVGNPRGLPQSNLFHLANDPAEMYNLSEAEPEKTEQAAERVARISEWARAGQVAASEVELDQVRQNAIERSGYGR
jgi:arylsulfatase A-like enzyme